MIGFGLLPVTALQADQSGAALPPLMQAQQVPDPAGIAGITKPANSVDLAFVVSGRVQHVNVQNGEFVKQGTILLSLEQQLETLDAQRKKLIADDRSDLEIELARKAQLNKQVSAAKQLRAQGAMSEDEYQALVLDAKESNSKIAQLRVREKIEALDYQLASATVSQRNLIAPFDGIVTKLTTEIGATLEPGTNAVRLVNTATGIFTTNLDSAIAQTLTVGQDILIYANAANQVTATITYIAPEADPASGLINLTAEYDNQSGAMLPGLQGFMQVK